MVPLVITCSTGRNPAWENAKKCGPDLSHCPGLPRPWPGCSHVHSLVLLTVFFLYLSLTLHWVWSLEEEAVWGYHHTQPMPTPSPSLIAWDFCPHCSGHTSWFWENFQWIAPYPGSWHSSSSLQRRFLTPILSSTPFLRFFLSDIRTCTQIDHTVVTASFWYHNHWLKPCLISALI